MKKILFAMIMLATCFTASAQYKKASFLTKGGRTYDLGGSARFMTGEHSLTPGLIFSYGKDKGTNRIFHWFDLEVLLPSKFSFKTIDLNTDKTVNITGKTTTSLVWRYNWAYYLADNTKEENKFLPFVTAGINLVVAGNNLREDEVTYSYSYSDIYIARSSLSYGVNIGIGAVYNISEKFGLKFTGGYNYQGNYIEGDDEFKFFYPYTSHPYITAGIRFKLNEDND